LKERQEEREDVEEDVRSYSVTFRNANILGTDSGSTVLYPLEDALGKRLWTHLKTT
jgi:hypothetical protein